MIRDGEWVLDEATMLKTRIIYFAGFYLHILVALPPAIS